MKLQEGPLFGALIIGVGVGYLTLRKTGSVPAALALGVGVGFADYLLLVWIQSFKKK